MESGISASDEFSEAILSFLEQLLELKSRPSGLNTWSDTWFEAHKLFVYETFLYIIASLIKQSAFEHVHNILTTHYLLPETESFDGERFVKFDNFYAYSEKLQQVLAPEGQTLYSPAAELIKIQANHNDISFQDVIQADLVVLLVSFITPDTKWYPQTLYYAGHGRQFPLFIRATQHKHFSKLLMITGLENVEELRKLVKEGHERLKVDTWSNFFLSAVSFWNLMNMDKLDSIK